jgi:hypothetical protein
MKTSEILAQAFGIVSAFPATGAYGRTKDGESVLGNDPQACSWCSLGALVKVTDNDRVGYSLGAGGVPGFDELTDAAKVVLDGKQTVYKYPSIPDVNDQYPELIPEMFRIAIAAAREKEACEVAS